MCKPSSSQSTFINPQKRTQLLFTLESFHCTDDKGEKGPLPPSFLSTTLTFFGFISFLFLMEQICTMVLTTTYIQEIHPLFTNDRNNAILSRHLMVDFLSFLFICYFALASRHLLSHEMSFKSLLIRQDSKEYKAYYDKFHDRLYTYSPEGSRVLLYFFAYQTKNLFDSIYWNDGLLFVGHHILASMAAFFGFYPGVASRYGIFYMGISEISSAVLSLLANFDETYGVPGLEHAFPMTRVVVGALFVMAFLYFRVYVWPIVSWHFLRDCVWALRRNSEKETLLVRFAIRSLMICLGGLTLLQFLWLGEIIMVARQEILKFL